MLRSTLILCLVCVPLTAQVAPSEIKISNEITPPGGMAQIKVSLTSPMPIVTGNMSADLSGLFFDSIEGIAMFSPGGDVAGAAVVQSGKVNVHFTSPKSTFGTVVDYPILTIAVTLPKFVTAGQKFAAALDPAASFWQNLLGPVPVLLSPGSISVGGSVSITNVVPGGGMLAAGASFDVLGTGFSPSTKLAVRGLTTSSIQYVSPTQFRVTVRNGGLLDGTLIQVQNPDKSTDEYYSYMRGVPMGASLNSLLEKTVPVFSTLTATDAIVPPALSAQLNSDYFTGLALQNPSTAAALVNVEARSAAGGLLKSTSVTIPHGSRLTRSATELFGIALPLGAYMHVTSSQPVQVLGLLGNEKAATMLPVAPSIIAGPAPPAPPPATIGGGGGGKKQ